MLADEISAELSYADLDSVLGRDRRAPRLGAGRIAQRSPAASRKATDGEQLSVVSPTSPRPTAPTPIGVGVHVEGLDDVLVRLSQCCTPVPGDDIVGFVTAAAASACTAPTAPTPRALMSDQAARLIDVDWDGDAPRRSSGPASRWSPSTVRGCCATSPTRSASSTSTSSSCSTHTGSDRVAKMRFEFELADPSHLDCRAAHDQAASTPSTTPTAWCPVKAADPASAPPIALFDNAGIPDQPRDARHPAARVGALAAVRQRSSQSVVESAGYGQVISPMLEDLRGLPAHRRRHRRRHQGDVRLRRQGRPPHRACVLELTAVRVPGASCSTGRRRRGRCGTPARSSATRSRSAARYRQFDQVGIEVLGADDPAPRRRSDRSRLGVLSRLGLRQSRCWLNSLGEPQDRAAHVVAAQQYFESHRASTCQPTVRATLDKNALRVLDLEAAQRRGIIAGARRIAESYSAQRRRPLLPRCRPGWSAVGVPYVVDDTPRARTRLLPAHDVRVSRAARSTRRRTRWAAVVATTVWSSRSAARRRTGIGFALGLDRTLHRLRRRRRVRGRPLPRVDAFVVDTTGGRRGAADSPPSCAPASLPIGPTRTAA